MSEFVVKQLKCIPNSTELGNGSTNDSYIRIPSEYEKELNEIFPFNQEFCLKDKISQKEYTLKITTGRELRITKLGPYYSDHDVKYGDEVIFTCICTKENLPLKKYINTIKHNRVIFSGKKGAFEVVNMDLLDAFKQGDNYKLNIGNEGDELEIIFNREDKKRSDSPAMTKLYNVFLNNDIESGSFYLDIDKGFVKKEPLTNEKQFCIVNIDSNDFSESPLSKNKNDVIEQQYALQQIFYGAPGTGKSHTIKKKTENDEVIRVTFHPDSDYSSFVGAYKPTTKTVPIRDINGQPVKDSNGIIQTEERITYQFVSQAFIQAYVSAWRKLAAQSEDAPNPEKVFLIIEEINRGNCAQIFGDLFQLLDRGPHGFSEYAIKTDADMKKHLQESFLGLEIPQEKSINDLFKDSSTVSKVISGDILLLPNNLYLWASMNTSDQSLFPIDSAFKRRWEWIYVPISKPNENWEIQIKDSKYDWWEFLERINEKIGATTNSEDKKLGYYFCKSKDGIISAETFVGKVIFYLWNDVFKDYDFDDDIFNDSSEGKLIFNKFYFASGDKPSVNTDKVINFLENLKLSPKNTETSPDSNEVLNSNQAAQDLSE